MTVQVSLLPRFPVWSLAGGRGPLIPGRAFFQLQLICRLSSVPHGQMGRSPSASSSAAGHTTKWLSLRQLSTWFMPVWLEMYRWRIILCVVPLGAQSAGWSQSMDSHQRSSGEQCRCSCCQPTAWDCEILAEFPALLESLWSHLSKNRGKVVLDGCTPHL